MKKPKVIIIQGPTAVGKTAVALSLAKQFPLELINADSMQVYRHLDIGTGKPAPAQQLAVPNHLLSIINPDEEFSAARFKDMAGKDIADIAARGHVPLVVGGTGLYIKALTRGLFSSPERNEALRRELKQKALQEGKESLYTLLKDKDPETARRLNPNDMVRIIRALEVFYLTGVPIAAHQMAHGFKEVPYATLKIGLTRDRDVLYELIERRVEQMIADGLLQEVASVLARGYSPELKSLQSIGYKQMVAYIQGGITWEEAIAQIKKQTKRFAKRQLTWFRHDPEIQWVTLPEGLHRIALMVKNFLKLP